MSIVLSGRPALAISGGTLAAIVVVLVLDLFAIVFGLSFRRARRAQRVVAEARAGGIPIAAAEAVPKAPKPVSRREFFRRSLLVSLGVFAAQFGGASLAFLWPNLRGGFGSLINAGSVSDIKGQIQSTNEPFYFGAGRFYVEFYGDTYTGTDPSSGINYAADGAIAEGLMALYQRCAHLGCRVPFCEQSQWFECPCHGSKYNKAGEYELGPAPNGLSRFPIKIEGGNLMVDTSTILPGPPRGTDTIHEPAQGQFCVAPG